jgi:hypothetical protein
VDGLDLSILGHERISFRAVLSKDGCRLEEEIELLVEFAGWVAEEANL